MGTGGRSTTSGGSLEQRFGLRSTLATFTTITTNAGTVAATVRRPAVGHNPDIAEITAETATAMAGLVHRVFAPMVPVVQGTIFPGTQGASIQVQHLVGSHWRTVASAKLGNGGSYSVRVSGSGSYRVQFNRMAGPAVGVS